jgi:hypothetical protein
VFANGAAALESIVSASFETVEITMHMVAMSSQVEDNEVSCVAARLAQRYCVESLRIGHANPSRISR